MRDHSRPFDLTVSEPRTYIVPMRACEDHLGSLQAGESPFWDQATGRLWLVDMYAPALISLCSEEWRCAHMADAADHRQLRLNARAATLSWRCATASISSISIAVRSNCFAKPVAR